MQPPYLIGGVMTPPYGMDYRLNYNLNLHHEKLPVTVCVTGVGYSISVRYWAGIFPMTRWKAVENLLALA